MKYSRSILFALVMSAAIVSLTGCMGAKDVAGPTSGVDTSPPQPPSSLSVSNDAAAQRDFLNWSPSASANVATYEIFRYDSDPSGGATGTSVGVVSSDVTVWALPLVNSPRTEYYRVRGVNGSEVAGALSTSAVANRDAWQGGPHTPTGDPGGRGIDPGN